MNERFATESGRLEAFSDGVLAVIITIMVLDLRPPAGTTFGSLHELAPTFLAYVLSFVFIGIYWINHHHLLRASSGIDGRVMWANLHLLFWLSLAPFTTAWVGANPSAVVPTALYGFGLLMDAFAYLLLQNALLSVNGTGSPFWQALTGDRKGRFSPLVFVVGTGLAFVSPILADVLFVAAAFAWLVPDRRLEAVIAGRARPAEDLA